MINVSETAALPPAIRKKVPEFIKKRTTDKPKFSKEEKRAIRKDTFKQRKAGMKDVARGTAVSTLATTGLSKAIEKTGKIVDKRDERKKAKNVQAFKKEFLENKLYEGGWGLAVKVAKSKAGKIGGRFLGDIAKEGAISGGIHTGTAIYKRSTNKKDARASEERKRMNAKKEISSQVSEDFQTRLSQAKTTLKHHGKPTNIKRTIKKHGRSAGFNVALQSGPDVIAHTMQRSFNRSTEREREKGSHQDVKDALKKKHEKKTNMNEAKKSKRDDGALMCWLRGANLIKPVSNPQLKRGVKLGSEGTKASTKAEDIVTQRSKEVIETLSTMSVFNPTNATAGMNAMLGPKPRMASAAEKSRTSAAAASRRIRANQ